MPTSATVVEESDYYPFGGERAVLDALPSQPYKFTGKERDPESSLDFFGARYMSSAMGRFQSPDPLLNSLRPNNAQTLNRYAYVLNNPLRFIDPTGQYEEDVHRDLTTLLALAVGFDADTAAAIGNATQGVDDDPKTSPYASVRARRDFHFTSQERRDQLWGAFELSGSTRDLGAFLHAQEDSYSHAGYGPRIGHVLAGHAPDKTYNDPAKANNMAKDIFVRLTVAADRLGVKQNNRVAWEKIDRLVGDFNKAKTREEKNKILGQLRDVIKKAQEEQQKKKPNKEKRRWRNEHSLACPLVARFACWSDGSRAVHCPRRLRRWSRSV
jgi:RHS repeat-associated protein